MILGLDCSTSVCGHCLFYNDTRFTLGHLNFEPNMNIISKIQMFQSYLEGLIRDFKDEYVFIFLEDYLKSYSSGRTSKQTIISLAQMNILVQYVITTHFKDYCKLQTLHVKTARKSALGFSIPNKLDKTKYSNQKDFVQQWFYENVGYDFPKKKRKVEDNIAESGDMIDAYIMARAGYKLMNV